MNSENSTEKTIEQTSALSVTKENTAGADSEAVNTPELNTMEPEAPVAPKKRPRGRPPKAKTVKPETPEDLEIGNDLYNLYIESFAQSKEDTVTIDVFEAIDEEDLPKEEILPNTAYIDKDEKEQIAFSDDFDEFDDGVEMSELFPEEKDTLPTYNEKKPRKIDGKFDFLELFIFTLLVVMILTSFIFRHSIVDGGSMLNTLTSGEHLIISDVFYTPSRGDIIVCEDYSTGIRKPIVKRVIAVGGDFLEIKADGSIYINGELITEEYVFIDGDAAYPVVAMSVPEGMIYVMGDHRNASTDSRTFGCVDVDAVLGKVLLRFYPFDKFGTVK